MEKMYAIVMHLGVPLKAEPPGRSWHSLRRTTRRTTMEVLIVAFLLILIGMAIWKACLAAKRRKLLQTWAASKGLRFNAGKDWTVEQRFPEFQCLRKETGEYAYNTMQGGWSGRGFLGFDYHYETRTTDSKGRRQTHHHYFSAVIVESDLPLKPLSIRPEGFFDKVTEFFGFDDIDFESAEFSRKFYVKAKDRRWAYDVIHTRTMEFLLGTPSFTIEFGRHHVIAYRGSTFTPEDFGAAADVISGVLERLPDYLVRQLKEGS